MKIVFVDFASEKNRGDEVMQIVMLSEIEKRYPNTDITVMAAYGRNQESLFSGHFDTQNQFKYRLVPGIRKTTNRLKVSAEEGPERSNSKLKSSIYLLQVFLLFICFALHPPLLRLFGYGEQLRCLEKADFVIWNGRNFRNRPGLGELYDVLAMIANPLFAIRLRKPVYALGVSIWDLHSKISRLVLGFVLARCKLVTCRESYSLNQAKQLGLKNICHSEDLSFIFLHQEVVNSSRPNKNTPSIAITVVDWKESSQAARQKYITSFADAISFCIEKGFKVRIVPQVNLTWESYQIILDKILEETGVEIFNGIEVITEDLDSKQLFEIYRKTDLLIGSRMHSTIYSAFAGARVIAVPYDVGAKWHIILDLGLNPQDLIEHDNVTSENLISRIDEAIRDEFRSNFSPEKIETAIEKRFSAFDVLPNS